MSTYLRATDWLVAFVPVALTHARLRHNSSQPPLPARAPASQVAFVLVARSMLLHYGEAAVPRLEPLWASLDLFMGYLDRIR